MSFKDNSNFTKQDTTKSAQLGIIQEMASTIFLSTPEPSFILGFLKKLAVAEHTDHDECNQCTYDDDESILCRHTDAFAVF